MNNVAAAALASTVERLQVQLSETQVVHKSTVQRIQSQVADAQAAHASTVEQLQLQLAETRAEYAGTVKQFQSQLTEIQAGHTGTVGQLQVQLAETQAQVNALKEMLAHSRCDVGAAHSLIEKLGRQQTRALLGPELSEDDRSRLRQAFDRCAPVAKDVSALHNAEQLRIAVLSSGVAPFGYEASSEAFEDACAALGESSGSVSFEAFCDVVRKLRAQQGWHERCVAFATERLASAGALRRCLDWAASAMVYVDEVTSRCGLSPGTALATTSRAGKPGPGNGGELGRSQGNGQDGAPSSPVSSVTNLW